MTPLAKVDEMKVLVQQADDAILAYLEERRQRGLDHRDEVWDGVLHVVPPPSMRHQSLGTDLLVVLVPLLREHGLRAVYEAGVFEHRDSVHNYRVPDLVVADPLHVSERGIEGRAELVVEVLSPNDTSRHKFEFYARCGVPEVWIVHPATRAIEVHVLRDGVYREQPVAKDGTIEAPRFALSLRVVEGPRLRVTWRDGSADI